MKKNLSTLEKKLQYTFTNKDLLQTALTHKTYAFEADQPIEYNERLEFLGDSILNFIVAKELYKLNTQFTEGELTRRRAQLVNNKLLAKKAVSLNIGSHLILGKGASLQNVEKNRKNLANTLEAIIGAIYIDSNLQTVELFILNILIDL
jgi:ribonuclease-3